jgi:predicted SnoaL-like aldol condensation-catalyzing enzyme
VNAVQNQAHLKKTKKDPKQVHKDIATEFLTLAGSGRPKKGLGYFAPECKTHNPYTAGSMTALVDAMIAVQRQGAGGVSKATTADFKLTIRQVLAEGNMVAVHTQVSSSKPSEGGLRQVHLFRFDGDKIVEYWDVTQQVPVDAPNAAGAFS